MVNQCENEPARNGEDHQNPAGIVANAPVNIQPNNPPQGVQQFEIPPQNAPVVPPPVNPAQPTLDDWRHLLRALVGANREVPEFAGRDHEDPNVFIRECEAYFVANETEVHARVRLAARSLKDDAARWWAVYKNLNVSWQKFCDLLRGRYASQSALMKLSSKLYGQAQSERESAGIFLEQRHLLARRLLPDAPEGQIIAVLLEALRGSLKKLLRSSAFETVEDLIARAVQIEQDELEERNATRRSAPARMPQETPMSRQRVTPASNSAPATRGYFNRLNHDSNAHELPQCQFCPGRHWHRDCPTRLTPGNYQGTADRAEPTVPDVAAP